mmetsp:Transcript_29862/g.70384  ORF Transcript_29862/g.70384 Transcript_29862/m.70384 type:complete len:663 (-) Transcript_29862:141-2129(-)
MLHNVLVASLILGRRQVLGSGIFLGAPECPCLDPGADFTLQAKLQVVAQDLALHPDYGLAGCQAYDADRSTVIGDCTVDSPAEWCLKAWCYINTTVCPVNLALCEAAACGSQPCQQGNTLNPHCRTRHNEQSVFQSSQVMALGLRYSYEACGHKDGYTQENAFMDVFNSDYLVTPLLSPPWTILDTPASNGAPALWRGVLPEFLATILQSVNGRVQIMEPPVSATSLEIYESSSWTACVHDISIGRLDMCLGDFWVTEERLRLANFLPAFSMDNFYLVVPGVEDESFGDVLWKPFRPFHPVTWLFIIIVLLVMGFFIYLVEREDNGDDFPETRVWTGLLKGAYFGFMSFLSGGPANAPATPAGRVMSLGLGLFLVLSLSAYTANLATFLIMTNVKSGISSVEQAVTSGKRICIAAGIADMIFQRYPTASLIEAPFYQCPKYIANGQADVAIMSDNGLDFMYSGDRVRSDCDGLSPGSTPYCPQRGGELDVRRDCKLVKAGSRKILLTVPIAIPIRKEVQHAVSWAQVHSTTGDVLQQAKDKYSNRFPQPMENCPAEGLGELDPMPVSGLVGTVVVSAFIFGIALVVHVVMRWHGKQAPHPDDLDMEKSQSLGKEDRLQSDMDFLKEAIGDIRLRLKGGAGRSESNSELEIVPMPPGVMHQWT